jgi:hypothetical protein
MRLRGRYRAAGLVFGVILATVVLASSGSPSRAEPSPDIQRARELYQQAEAAMKDGRYADAARDYGGAYEITKDPVLFFKLGGANDRGKKCNVALIYYRRYLREGKPNEDFTRLTRSRIAACGGNPDDDGSGAGSGSATGGGSAGSAAGSAEPGPEPDPGLGSGSTPPPPPPRSVVGRHRMAWIFIGGAIASFTAGAVLAYSANASEKDVEDLYVGLGGTPPQFDARTKASFDDLVAEGKRYEKLSWIGFGLAGGLAIAATIRFLTDKDEPVTMENKVGITPVITPRSAGVSATLRF